MLQSVMLCKPHAPVAWLFLESEFLGQHESRALLLEAEFSNLKYDSLCISDYCWHLETMVTALGDATPPFGP